ncbi:MAG: aspartate kinase [Actinomycetota bacterium]
MPKKNGIVVMKFGGTSVADADKIRHVAQKVVAAKEIGNKVVVTVSAMGSTTDDLIGMAKQITGEPSRREMDMLLSTGEQVSIALLSMAIHEKNHPCISLTGNQAGILTDNIYTNAKILSISCNRILDELKNGKIVIVAGFQGVSRQNDITTLGRGGSDTTAVALASALKAKYCEIYTDVRGVYTTDPNLVPEAKKIHSLSYDEMLEMASSGAKVLHLRAVEFAKKHNVILHVRSSFNDIEGTWIMERTNEKMERPIITGVSYDTNQIKITVYGLLDEPGIAARLFGALARENVNVDLIVQNVSEKNIATISLTVTENDKNMARKTVEKLGYENVEIDPEVSKVSIVGAGMQTHPGIAAKMFKLLGEENINIEMISTSPIRISCIIRKDKIKKAVRALHKGFELHK